MLTKNLFILLAGWRTSFGAVSAAVATPFWWGGIYRRESFHLVVRKQVSPSCALMGETSNHRGGNRMRLTHSCLNRRCQRLAFSSRDDSAKRKTSLVRKQVSTLMIISCKQTGFPGWKTDGNRMCLTLSSLDQLVKSLSLILRQHCVTLGENFCWKKAQRWSPRRQIL